MCMIINNVLNTPAVCVSNQSPNPSMRSLRDANIIHGNSIWTKKSFVGHSCLRCELEDFFVHHLQGFYTVYRRNASILLQLQKLLYTYIYEQNIRQTGNNSEFRYVSSKEPLRPKLVLVSRSTLVLELG